MKKILYPIVILALVLALLVPAGAAGATLTVKAPDGTIAAGERFIVTVELTGNEGFNTLQFTIPYDADAMECTAARGGEVLRSMLYVTNPEAVLDDGRMAVIVASAGTSANTADGVAAELYFTAKKDLTDPVFQLEDIGFSDGTASLPITAAFERVAPEAEPEIDETIADSGSDIGVADYDIDPEDLIPQEPTKPDPIPEPVAPGKTEETEPAQPGSEETEEITFPDTVGHWGESYIKKAAALGLFKGGTDGKFYPDAPVTRAQFVTVLYRMAGSPETTAETPFTDTDGEIQEFKNAIAWAYENGIVNGTGDGTTFTPSGTLTREQAMKILYFYAGGEPGGEVEKASDYDSRYADSGEISSWARQSVYWGVFNELIQGTGDGKLSPQATASRAALAKILVSFLDKFSN